jgi:hypothetical protein
MESRCSAAWALAVAGGSVFASRMQGSTLAARPLVLARSEDARLAIRPKERFAVRDPRLPFAEGGDYDGSMGTPSPNARSIVDLYRQLIALGWGEESLARVRDAYAFASGLHAARFRPDGRPFIDHVVGTAGLLAADGAPEEVVLAGLLHGVYDHGDFGDGTRGVDPAKRARVRAETGAEVEDRVAAFSGLDWRTGAAGLERDRVGQLDALGRDALWIRLANELEELLAFEIHFRRRAEERLADLDAEVQRLAGLARALGRPALAEAIERAGAECRNVRLPAMLRASPGANYDRLPDSVSPRLRVVADATVARLRAALGRRLARLRAR